MNDLLEIIRKWALDFESDFEALQKSLERKLRRAEASLLRRIIADVMPKLGQKDGALQSGVRNMARVNLIERVFDELGADETNAVLIEFADALLGIAGKDAAFYLASGFDEAKVKAIASDLSLLRQVIGIDAKGNLAQDGFLFRLGQSDAVRQTLKQYVQTSIATGRKLADFTRGLKELVQGNTETNGALTGYYQQYAYDTYSRVREVSNLHFADELELTNFVYTGGLIQSSRAFCVKKNGKVFSRKEAVEKWPKDPDLIDKKHVASYNPLIDRGRNNCRHFLMYISDERAAEMRGMQDAKIQEQGIQNVEDKIRNQDFESAALYDKDGNRILFKNGEKSQVTFTRAEIALMKDGVLTHNHPNSLSFSDADMTFFADHGLKEIRAVSRRFDYSLTNPTGKRVPVNDIMDYYTESNRVIAKQLSDGIKAGAFDKQFALDSHGHYVNERVAEHFGFNYSRTRRKKGQQ